MFRSVLGLLSALRSARKVRSTARRRLHSGILSQQQLDDAVGGAAQVGAADAPFLFADANSLPEFTTAELQALADTLTTVLVYADSTDVSSQVLAYIQQNG